MLSREIEGYLDDILEYIDYGNVIPIIGQDLLRVERDGQPISLYPYIARELAATLNVRLKESAREPSLNDVVCEYLDNKGQREDIYAKLRPILDRAGFQPPQALQHLARIDRFKLFVVLTFDSLLATAIDQVRHLPGGRQTLERAYSPAKPEDLPYPAERLSQPLVYHLLGKLSAQPNEYVVTDEDMLEFLYRMQTSRPPEKLFDALRENHLLFIGCTFSDWLARFLIRIARGGPARLSQGRAGSEALISDIAHDENLVLFLQYFSPRTKIIRLPPAEFVAELANRYELRRDKGRDPGASVPTSSGAAYQPAAADSEEGAVFISYAHEDYEAARRLRDFLCNEVGVKVWFDKADLKGGEDWELTIGRRLANCSYFMPVISATAARIREGYFRSEWTLAANRSLRFKEGVPFIIPVAIDNTEPNSDGVPGRFSKANWIRLPDGEGNSDFANRMRELMDQYPLRKRG